MKKLLAMTMVLCLVLALCAGCGSKDEGASWADYQAYLVEKAGSNAPDLDEFKAQIDALKSWDDIDTSVSPWDQMFTTVGLSTWDEFKAGTVKEPAVSGSMGGDTGAASGEMGASGEATAAADGDVPASGTVENTAHGTATADMAGYQAYLHAWLEAEFAANSSMDETMKGEFEALIDAADFETFPADMLFNGMLTTGSAMTYDAFVAAGGVY